MLPTGTLQYATTSHPDGYLMGECRQGNVWVHDSPIVFDTTRRCSCRGYNEVDARDQITFSAIGYKDICIRILFTRFESNVRLYDPIP